MFQNDGRDHMDSIISWKKVSSFSYLTSSNIYSLSYKTIFKLVTQATGKGLNMYIEYKQRINNVFLVAINKYESSFLSNIMV